MPWVAEAEWAIGWICYLQGQHNLIWQVDTCDSREEILSQSRIRMGVLFMMVLLDDGKQFHKLY